MLDETITLLFRRLPFKTAKGSLSKIDKAIKEGYLHVEWVTSERFEKAKGLRLKYQDKPKISFTDLTSMVVMKELGVKEIITGDEVDGFVKTIFPSFLDALPREEWLPEG